VEKTERQYFENKRILKMSNCIQDHISIFVLNGYEDVENFIDLNESELDYLGIRDPRIRAKIMAAVERLQAPSIGCF